MLDRRMFLRNGFQESEYHASLRAARLIVSIEAIVSKRIEEAEEPEGILALCVERELTHIVRHRHLGQQMLLYIEKLEMPHGKQAMRWCSLIGASCGDASEAEAEIRHSATSVVRSCAGVGVS